MCVTETLWVCEAACEAGALCGNLVSLWLCALVWEKALGYLCVCALKGGETQTTSCLLPLSPGASELP